MKTANMGNRVRVGVLLTMFVVATLMLVMTHATSALATGSTAASFEANSYEFSVDENTAANTVVGTVGRHRSRWRFPHLLRRRNRRGAVQ